MSGRKGGMCEHGRCIVVLYVAIAHKTVVIQVSCFVHATYVARGPARAPVC